MSEKSNLRESRNEAKLLLERSGVKLQTFAPRKDLKPVETTFEMRGVPLDTKGNFDIKIAEALELLLTPPNFVYHVTVRFTEGSGAISLDTGQIQEVDIKGNRSAPINAKRALERAVEIAEETDDRSQDGFRCADLECFPYEWKWGKNIGDLD